MTRMNSSYDIYIMIIGVTVVLLILICFIVAFLFIYKNRQVHHHMEMKSIQEKYDQEILKTQLEIKEQTLKNISEEIHDNVGQLLSLAVLNLSAINFNDVARAESRVENISQLVKKAVTDLRNLSKTLDHEYTSTMGLCAITRFELEMLEKTGLYQTSFRTTGPERRLDASKEIILYRIIQESLNNMMKHSNASEVSISMDFGDDRLDIEIKDNGRGFDPAELEKDVSRKGLGLKNIAKRAQLIHAALDIKAVPSQGTAILLTVPFTSETPG